MNGNRSVATIDAPEFINLEPFNPLISQCEIKVLYLGKNRNGSYITKDVAIQMANSLPGCPIVGAYREEIEDFGDHGHVMRIEDGEVHFSVKTKPYGFVAPDANVWFKDFTDTDAFGNEETRTYLMTTGYLWTGQYEEAQSVLNEGKGQSMELDEKNLSGTWAEDNNSGLEFFIINDAVFSKLCILGDGVEPCFEGAAVTAPDVSKDFSKDETFHQTLFTMMKELKDALESKGGSGMPEEFEQIEETESAETIDEPTTVEFDENSDDATETVDSLDPEAEVTEESPAVEEPEVEEVETIVEETQVNDMDDEEDEEEVIEEKNLDDDDVEDVARRLIDHSVEEMQQELENLRAEVESLREFKHQAELKEKYALIEKYYMLDEGDKAPFIENIENYSLEDLESKLALVYVTKNVNFDAVESEDSAMKSEDMSAAVTYTLEDDAAGTTPPLVEALRRTVHK